MGRKVQQTSRRQWLTRRGLYCIVPIVLTASAFHGVWNDSFTNWDDKAYVTDNILIHSLSCQNILLIFSPVSIVSGNYQPITILSYALSYAAGRLNPAGYILADLLLHLLNVLLVFIFILRLSKSDFAASLCALLFGIHPMHVESVAWISDRKDLLCTLFYLTSALWYLSYLDKRTGSATLRYSAACILFVCSLLSKSAAVTLPAVLFLIDYYRVRKFSKKMIIDKILFIVPAIIFGLWAIKGQHDAGSLHGNGMLSFLSRISIAGYSFMFYVVKFFFPLKLSAFYPYPVSFPVSLPLRYSLSLLFVVASAGVVWYFRRTRLFVFGFGFFLINVIFILHFIAVGATVTADRFSYLAYIGLSFIVGCYCEKGVVSLRLKSARVAVSAALLCFVTLVFGYAVHERCRVWKNSETLWTDVVGKYPSALAYNNCGYAYYSNHDYGRALEDYTAGLLLNPSNADLYNDRGLLYDAIGDHAKALEDYNRAISNKLDFAKAYNNRGLDYYAQGDYERAINDFDRAISLDPTLADAYNNRGNVLNSKGEYAGAMADYSRAVLLNPECAEVWYNQGRVYKAMNAPDKALACFTKTIELDSAYAQAYNSRGVVFCMRSDFDGAIADFNRAIGLQPSSIEALVNRGNAWSAKGDYQRAISDFSRAIGLAPAPTQYPQAFFNRGLAYRAIGDTEHAGEDFGRACAMQLNLACRELQQK